MTILKTAQEVRTVLDGKDRSIGFVPTMGALHEGHLSLVKRSLEENKITIVSIFLNKTQFNDPVDYEKYPVSLDADVRLLDSAGVSFLFLPDYNEIYPDGYRYRVKETPFSEELCGLTRPEHFDGVLSVVLKLLLIVRPARAYFGEKDYQQYLLIRDMVQAFFIETAIIPCPIVRESSGLAMSSRNRRLSPEGFVHAAWFFRILSSNESLSQMKARLTEKGFSVDYLIEREGRLYGAVFLEGIRLIDNVER